MSTYDYYRIFYHVAQQHSFTKAAEVLHNNQPNITRCMNNLETELGCHLFVRSNRGVSLTPEGQKLFNHVAIAFEQLELGETELKRDQRTHLHRSQRKRTTYYAAAKIRSISQSLSTCKA